jgi:hypothetical protein
MAKPSVFRKAVLTSFAMRDTLAPMASTGGRPRVSDELLVNATVRLDGDDWAVLERLYGSRRAAIVRQLVAHHLRTGTPAPPRPAPEAIAAARTSSR